MAELLQVDTDAEWDALLEQQPEASLFHTSAWLRLQQRFGGFDLFPLALRDAARCLGLLPVFTQRRGVFRVASSPRGIDYVFLGPLVGPERLAELLDAYEAWAARGRIDYTSMALTREVACEAARIRGWHCERQRNHLVDLTGGEQAVLARCHKDCREAIRKAQRHGVQIIEGDLSGLADRYLELSARIFAKSQRRTRLTRGFLLDMLGTLQRCGRLLSLRAEVDGRLAGMYVAGHYGKTIYALDTVSDYALARHSANTLMNWHLMRWGCRNGMEVFDLQGANIPSIAAYKASFGGGIVWYTNIQKAHGLAARGAVWLRKALAREFARLPRRLRRRPA